MGDLSNFDAGVNVLKGMIGLGLLNLPYAIKQIGLLPGLLGMFLIAWMSVYGIFYAVMAKQKFDKMKRRQDDTEKADVVAAVAGANKNYKAYDVGLGCFDEVVFEVYGWPGQTFYAFSITLGQFGTAIAYVTTIAESVEGFSMLQGLPRTQVLVGIGILLTLLSMVKTLRGIAVLSFLGLTTYLFIFAALLWETGLKISEGTWGQSVQTFETTSPNIAMWFGIVVFAFGAFPIAIAVYEEMETPFYFYKVNGWSYVWGSIFYAAFAVLGYMCYGSETKSIIYFNFKQGSFFYTGSLVCISFVLLFSWVLQMVPVWNFIHAFIGDSLHYAVTRTVTVVLTILAAYLIPDTATLVEITGSFAASLACLSLPPLVYLRMHPRPEGSEYPMAVALIALGGLGAMAAFL